MRALARFLITEHDKYTIPGSVAVRSCIITYVSICLSSFLHWAHQHVIWRLLCHISYTVLWQYLGTTEWVKNGLTLPRQSLAVSLALFHVKNTFSMAVSLSDNRPVYPHCWQLHPFHFRKQRTSLKCWHSPNIFKFIIVFPVLCIGIPQKENNESKYQGLGNVKILMEPTVLKTSEPTICSRKMSAFLYCSGSWKLVDRIY